MNIVVKWLAIIFGGLLSVLIVAAVALSMTGASRFNTIREISVVPIEVPSDEAALARGEHLVSVSCTSCHGANLAGAPLMEDGAIAAIYAPNITGLSATHATTDIVRAIRHGVAPDGRQLMIMPAETFVHFSEEDLGAIIAYLQATPRSGEAQPASRLGPLGRILLGAGIFGDVFPAELIDHNAAYHDMPPVGANVEYGEYLSRMCIACHGDDLGGGQPGDPQSPPAPSLRNVATWSEEQFFTAMRTGVNPSGRALDSRFMPWQSLGKLHDDELRAFWLYLQTESD